MVTGRCNCGAVHFEAKAVRDTVTFCHCSLCRRMSGHYWAATVAKLDDLTIRGEEALRWYAASDVARRGFCGTCGCNLFFLEHDGTHMGIAAGALDAPTGLAPGKHIFTADAGDYYAVPDDAPHVKD